MHGPWIDKIRIYPSSILVLVPLHPTHSSFRDIKALIPRLSFFTSYEWAFIIILFIITLFIVLNAPCAYKDCSLFIVQCSSWRPGVVYYYPSIQPSIPISNRFSSATFSVLTYEILCTRSISMSCILIWSCAIWRQTNALVGFVCSIVPCSSYYPHIPFWSKRVLVSEWSDGFWILLIGGFMNFSLATYLYSVCIVPQSWLSIMDALFFLCYLLISLVIWILSLIETNSSQRAFDHLT